MQMTESNSDVQDVTSDTPVYDVVIVGTGLAGAIVAAELGKIPAMAEPFLFSDLWKILSAAREANLPIQ